MKHSKEVAKKHQEIIKIWIIFPRKQNKNNSFIPFQGDPTTVYLV